MDTPLAPANYAWQHLVDGDKPVTLCGMSLPFEGSEGDRRLLGTTLRDAKDGFLPSASRAGCQQCADALERRSGGARTA